MTTRKVTVVALRNHLGEMLEASGLSKTLSGAWSLALNGKYQAIVAPTFQFKTGAVRGTCNVGLLSPRHQQIVHLITDQLGAREPWLKLGGFWYPHFTIGWAVHLDKSSRSFSRWEKFSLAPGYGDWVYSDDWSVVGQQIEALRRFAKDEVVEELRQFASDERLLGVVSTHHPAVGPWVAAEALLECCHGDMNRGFRILKGQEPNRAYNAIAFPLILERLIPLLESGSIERILGGRQFTK